MTFWFGSRNGIVQMIFVTVLCHTSIKPSHRLRLQGPNREALYDPIQQTRAKSNEPNIQ